jgi:cytochrome c peroxidase
MAIPKLRWLICLAVLGLTGCGKYADDLFCDDRGCGWAAGEWDRVASLANPAPPPPDPSNALFDQPAVAALGQMFFFDPAFSGTATQVDAIERPSPPARAAQGQPIGISCATCHDLARAGVDTTSSPGHVSVGAGWTDVNALAVVNSAYRNVVFWNGRADSLWALNVIVAESRTTLNGNRLHIAHELVGRYRQALLGVAAPWILDQLRRHYNSSIDPPGVQTLFDTIAALPTDGKPGKTSGCNAGDATEPFNDAYDCLGSDLQKAVTTLLVFWAKAIAAYEYQLVSVQSDFDKFVAAGPDSDAIPAAAQRGARLFVGKAACIDCHAGPQLTDEQFHDIGIPQTGLAVPRTSDCPASNNPAAAACDCFSSTALKCAPWGAYDGLRRLQATDSSSPIFNKWLRTRTWSDNTTDTSRAAYLSLSLDGLKGAWRTPSLRNVALTAPYMHDGRYATLQDVIWHYNTGGTQAGPEQVGVLASEIKPLMLTDGEQADLLAFLETLTSAPLDSALVQPPTLPASGSTGTGGTGGTMATGAGGTSGPTGVGGAGGAGGIGMTGAGGAGAGGAQPPVACRNTPAPTTITTFSTTQGTNPTLFSGPNEVSGWTFSTAPAGLTPTLLTVGPGNNGTPALQLTTKPVPPPSTGPAFYVFGLTFDDCLDASAFKSVQFTISSPVVAFGCSIEVGVTSRQNVNKSDDPRGACPTTCDPPLTLINQSGTLRIAFTGGALGGALFDPTQIIGVQWRVPVTCGVALSIDDVQFVNQ